MNWFVKLINSEPVAFWTGAVGIVTNLAVEYGLNVSQNDKTLAITIITAVCAFVARGKVSPAG